MMNDMSEKEQIEHFATELDRLCDWFGDEYDLTRASVIGVLQMKLHAINKEAWEEFPEP